MSTIKRNLVLKMMAVRRTPAGDPYVFSIKFCDKQGKIRFFPQAISCGAGRMNEYEHRVRGVQPCCARGNPYGHPYPVSIDRIREFNGMEVMV